MGNSERWKPGGKRRGNPPKTRRYDQILAAAFKVFAAKGFAAATLDEVAGRAGVAKGTIYLYFKDKEQLFRAVARSLIQTRFESWGRDRKGSAPELLRELILRMYSQIVTNDRARSMIRMLIAESVKFPQLSEIYHREIISPGMQAVRAVLHKGMASGDFRKTRATAFPQILAAPAVLATVWRLIHGERHRLNLDAYLLAHLDFVMSGLQRSPAGKVCGETRGRG